MGVSMTTVHALREAGHDLVHLREIRLTFSDFSSMGRADSSCFTYCYVSQCDSNLGSSTDCNGNFYNCTDTFDDLCDHFVNCEV
jgi:hypothetical protein